MSLNPSESAWLLVRKASSLTNVDIIDVTGIHPVTLLHMRARRTVMLASNIVSRESWALDCPAAVITP